MASIPLPWALPWIWAKRTRQILSHSFPRGSVGTRFCGTFQVLPALKGQVRVAQGNALVLGETGEAKYSLTSSPRGSVGTRFCAPFGLIQTREG